MIREYESLRGKLGETTRIKLDKLFSAFLSRNIQDFALKTSKLYTEISDVLEVWEEALWLDIDSSSSELLRLVYDNFFTQTQPHIKKSSDYFYFWKRICRSTSFTVNSQAAGWGKKIIGEERYQSLLTAELNAFQEKGEITPELIEYLHLPHPDESRYQIQLALDDIAFKELKKKFNLNGNISDLQAGPVIELVQAYNRFTKMLLNC
ncbi:MAG TPA: hypothetical protein PKI61_03215 [bacterium]|nr:hypothetical protein [bacterium]HPT30057.1 hypothetical protein [bacterium]